MKKNEISISNKNTDERREFLALNHSKLIFIFKIFFISQLLNRTND